MTFFLTFPFLFSLIFCKSNNDSRNYIKELKLEERYKASLQVVSRQEQREEVGGEDPHLMLPCCLVRERTTTTVG